MATRLASERALYLGSDASFRRLRVSGTDSYDLLNRLSASELTPEADSNGVFLNEKGRIIALYSAAVVSREELVLVVYAEQAEALAQHIEKYTIIEDVSLSDCSNELRQLTAICSGSSGCLDTGFTTLTSPFSTDEICRKEILVPAAEYQRAASALTGRGFEPLGDEQYESLRLSLGWLCPSELNEQVNPLEAGLAELVSFTKGCYIGQEVIARLDTYDKVQRSLVKFTADCYCATALPLLQEDRAVGWVASCDTSVTDGVCQGLAYIKKSALAKDAPITAEGGTIKIVKS